VVVDGIKAVILSRDTRPADQRAGDWEVIADSQDSQDPFWVKYPMECYGISLSLKPEALSLDLEDATGRAHAAWWLAEKGPGAYGAGQLLSWVQEGTGWLLHTDGADFIAYNAKSCPDLAHLNPDDSRLLPDGSPWVDAEALRLVCLHVGGVA